MADFQYNNFVNGLVTDVTDLNAPENSLKSCVNMDISYDGSIFKRNSLLEATTLAGLTLSGNSQKYWIWEADTGYTYRIVFDGTSLYFYGYSDSILKKTLSLTSTTKIDISTGKNSCYVATGKELFYVVSNTDGSISNKNVITLKIRDLSGIDDGLYITERPASLPNDHLYNLLNQGWGVYLKEYSSGSYAIDYVHFNVAKSVYPSNADNPVVAMQANPAAGDEDRFRVENLESAYLGTSKAPKGSTIIHVNDQATTKSNNGIPPTLDLDTLGKTTSNTPTTVAFHAGRAFYSGITGNNEHTSSVFFSKLLSSSIDAGECYQDADPTSREISDLVDTDGGYIPIPEAKGIFKLESYRDTLMVFADNGIWGITGTDSSFLATLYRVYKIADVTPISNSISLTEFGVAFATKEGIFTLSPDTVTGDLQPTNIVLGKIQNLYNDLTDEQKVSIDIAYDSANKRLNMLYKDTLGFYTNLLVFNAPLQCYYTYKFSTDDVVGLAESPVSYFVDVEDDVVDSLGATVTTSTSETVTVPIRVAQNIPTKLEFLIGGGTARIATLTGTVYNDIGAGEFEGEFITNPIIFKDLPREKQVTKLVCQFRKTETGFLEDVNGDYQLQNESSCLVQSRWDYAESSGTGKFGTEYQAYRHKRLFVPDDTLEFSNYTVVESKTRLRGSGKALQIRFKGESGKNLNMLGYAMEVTYRRKI